MASIIKCSGCAHTIARSERVVQVRQCAPSMSSRVAALSARGARDQSDQSTVTDAEHTVVTERPVCLARPSDRVEATGEPSPLPPRDPSPFSLHSSRAASRSSSQ